MAQPTLNSDPHLENKPFAHLDEIESRFDDLHTRITKLAERSTQFAKQNPVYTIMGAAAAGLLVGLVLQARKR